MEIDPTTTTEDDRMAMALAEGMTVVAAAEMAGVCRMTVQRRRSKPEFQRRVAELRAIMLDRAIGHLSAAAADAVIVMRNVMRNKMEEDEEESGDERSKIANRALRLKAAESLLSLLFGRAKPADVGGQSEERQSESELEGRLRLLSDEQLAKFSELAAAFQGMESKPIETTATVVP